MQEKLEVLLKNLDKIHQQTQKLTESLSKQRVPGIIPDWYWHLRYAILNKGYINHFHELPKNADPVSREDFVIEFCKGRKVLHVGCADEGFLELKLRDGVLLHQKLFAVSQQLVGIDISAKGIELLRNAGLENVFVCDVNNVDKLPFKDFDVVFLGEVLEHLPNPGQALQALKIFSDAEFLISVPNAYSWQGINFVKRGIEYVHPDHCFYFSFSTLRTLLRKCGYQIADLRFYTAHLNNPDLAGRLKEQPYFGEGIICISRVNQSEGDVSDIRYVSPNISFEEKISLLDYQLQADENTLSGIQKELLGMKESLTSFHKEFSVLRQTVSDKDKQLERLVEQIQGKDKTLLELHQMLSDKTQESEKLLQVLSDKEKELSGLQQTLTQIHNSLTWRLLKKYDTVINSLLPEGTQRRLWYNRIFLSIGRMGKKGADSKVSETIEEPIDRDIEEIIEKDTDVIDPKDDRMRLMVFIHYMAMGGAERCISVLLNEMNRAKIIPELVTVYDREMCYTIPEDVKVHILEKESAQSAPPSDFALPLHLQAFANDLAWLEQTAFKLSKVIITQRPSVILAQDFFASVILLLAKRHIPANVRLIVSVRCMLSMLLPTKKAGELYSFLVRSLFNDADSVIANSNGIAEELKTVFGVKSHKVSVIYNSVNPVKLRYLADEPAGHIWFYEDIPILLFVGWLEPHKGVSYLLKAVSLLKKSAKVRCALIGEGKEENDLRQLAVELGIAEDVLFLGRQRNPFKFMRRSTIFVLPSLTEGSPNVLLEALACGCPVIASDTPGGGPAEILKGGECGLLVPPGNEKTLSEAILRLLQDEGLRRRLSTLALQRARDFDVGLTVQAYENLFLSGTKEDAGELMEEQRDDRALVIIVIPTMGSGGAERCASLLLNNMNRSIFKLELVTIFDREVFYKVPEDVSVYVLENQPKPPIPDSCLLLPSYLQEYKDNYSWLKMTAARLAKIIRERRPSTIMAQDYFASFIVLLAKEYIPQKIKLVVSAHNSPAGLFSTSRAGELYKFFTKRLFNEADHIISVSEGVTRELKSDFGVAPEKIITLHNPVDLIQIQSMAKEKITEHAWFDEDTPIALFVGGLAQRKGLIYLLKALSMLKKSAKLRCVLIGEGTEKENLQKLAKDLGIAKNVVFLGRQQNPFKFMKRATMFILPSLTEGLPYVLIEALACGCPIIATDSPGGGPAEILKNGEYGLLIPPGDEKALAEAIKELLLNNELRQKLSNMALKRANEFDLESAIKVYENIFST